MDIISKIKKIKNENKNMKKICQEYLTAINYYYYIDCDDYYDKDDDLIEIEENVKKWLIQDEYNDDAKKLLELLF